jgi:hypothetical protein
MGTMLEDCAFKAFLDRITDEFNIEKVPFEFPESCTVVTREGDGKTYYFILNYGKEEVNISCNGKEIEIAPVSYAMTEA